MPQFDLPEAVAGLLRAQRAYADVQTEVESSLAAAQAERETSMKRVAALGLSHRRIGELTGMSHTRVNQILGRGTKRPPQDIHFPPGFLAPPKTVSLAALRAIGEHGPRAWSLDEIDSDLAERGWPRHDLQDALVDLVTDGVLLSADHGRFTLHAYPPALDEPQNTLDT